MHVNTCWPTVVDMTSPSGTRRSDGTRAAILAAARQRFSEDGYERATIRAIAADADIDPSMVMRYYGNKEKLFAAAAEFNLELTGLEDGPLDEMGARLASHVIRLWDGDETLMALLRAAVTNDPVAETARRIFATQLGPVLRSVCPNEEEAAKRAGLISSQVLGLVLTRYILKFPPVVALTKEEVVHWLGPTLQRYLTG
ncbi:TetR family transcriptional regulator [Fodinicola feengrottensis]|uniref:TetR family transcriptional regulator n=2 Tax=Fodinicola feengrottensis TaxID=435914 RepID=A0ABP4S135_9ACTN